MASPFAGFPPPVGSRVSSCRPSVRKPRGLDNASLLRRATRTAPRATTHYGFSPLNDTYLVPERTAERA
eukprot:3369572-Prymnesium_polylepis.1